MLTIYNKKSGFKKKFTVVAIWIIATAMLYTLINFLSATTISMGILIVPAIMAFIVIAAILLRCKVGRAFTLIGVYITALLPFMTALLTNTPLNPTVAIYSVLFALFAIYVFSNEKAMDLFYIESNPKEHIFYALIAGVMTWGYLTFL